MIATLSIVAAATSGVHLAQHEAEVAPKVTASTPANGAMIRPGPFVLSVTFDRPMRRDGFSFATGPERRFPNCEGTPSVSPDGRTFALRCTAQPGQRYVIWANHGRFMNFRSAEGVSAPPTRIGFAVAR